MEYQETSREAWESFIPVSATLDRQILETLSSSAGATCQEVEKRTGRSHQAVSGNLRHLVERDVVRNSERRRPVDSGRSAIVWEIIPPPRQGALL